MIAPTTTSSVVMGTMTPPWRKHVPANSHARSCGDRTCGRPLEIAACTGSSTSAQCAASMPSAARIPKVSAMARPAVPISWRRCGIARSAEPLLRPVRSAGAARLAVWRVASDARCVGVPSRRPARTANRITMAITITTPTRAIHNASFIGPLVTAVAHVHPAFSHSPWVEVWHIAPAKTRGAGPHAASEPRPPFVVRRRPFVA